MVGHDSTVFKKAYIFTLDCRGALAGKCRQLLHVRFLNSGGKLSYLLCQETSRSPFHLIDSGAPPSPASNLIEGRSQKLFDEVLYPTLRIGA